MLNRHCAWCQGVVLQPPVGRSRLYCKAACRIAANGASRYLINLLRRPQTPYTLNATARLLVAADLVSRGLRVYDSLTADGVGLVVRSHIGQLVSLEIEVERHTGEGAPAVVGGTDALVVVRRDGRIEYHGFDPAGSVAGSKPLRTH